MSDGKKSGLKIFDKLKKIKHIEIYIAVIFIVIILLIYMSTNKTKTSKQTKENKSNTTITGYIEHLEDNLEEILPDIKGVSNVNVLITLDMDTATVKDSNILLDKFPEIKGIVITAKGVKDTTLKMKVLRAVQTVVDVNNGRIEILSSE
ncbi:MAG: hypothetical protein IKA36_02320 [Clostridia bacterium]|nr:hypothetical protein [Clostridia bacterium]